MLTADQIASHYAANLKETITVRRYTGAPGSGRSYVEASVRGRAWSEKSKELTAAVQQDDWRALLLYSDLNGSSVAHPLKAGDKLIVGGKELAVMAAPTRKAPDGTAVVYDVEARG